MGQLLQLVPKVQIAEVFIGICQFEVKIKSVNFCLLSAVGWNCSIIKLRNLSMLAACEVGLIFND